MLNLFVLLKSAKTRVQLKPNQTGLRPIGRVEKTESLPPQMLDIVDRVIPQLHTTSLVHFFEKKPLRKDNRQGRTTQVRV